MARLERRRLLGSGLAAAMLLAGREVWPQPAAPERSEELTALPIAELAPLIRARAVSPVELTRAYLARIERLEPRVNAYVTVTAELALEQARSSKRSSGAAVGEARCMGFRSRSRTISTLPASRRRPQARSTADYVQARRELALTRRAITETFAEVDLLITPTAPAFPETIASAESAVGGGADAIPPGRNTLPFNLYGIPTISVPCGFGRSGLPIGLQISVPRSARSTCSHSPTPTSA